MRVRCIKNGADSHVFTDGKVYVAEHVVNALYRVRDDRGDERFIIPDQPCPHLVKQTGVWGWQVVVGIFQKEA